MPSGRSFTSMCDAAGVNARPVGIMMRPSLHADGDDSLDCEAGANQRDDRDTTERSNRSLRGYRMHISLQSKVRMRCDGTPILKTQPRKFDVDAHRLMKIPPWHTLCPESCA
jgi:hypothetical protein